MNRTDCIAPEAGTIRRSLGGIETFVPAPLPPAIDYSPRFVLALSRADAVLSELSGVGRLLPNPHLLISSYLSQEAVLSSRIEGTRASLSDILLDEVGGFKQGASGEEDRQEVRNYVVAMESGIDRLRAGYPISLNLIKELHRILMFGVRGELASPGQFRTIQNWIGPSRSTVEDAIYVPPPPELLLDCLSDWEQFVNAHEAMPDLVQCAVMHAQFEAIHPFIDGNGRIGRLLISLFLLERNRLSQPLLYLSAYLERYRSDYYDLLQRIRTHGDWNAWNAFFLIGVEQVAKQAVQQTTDLIEFREELRTQLHGKPNTVKLIDDLLGNPYLTVARAAKILEKSAPTARVAIADLEKRGLLREITHGSWRRVYVCQPVLDIILAATEG